MDPTRKISCLKLDSFTSTFRLQDVKVPVLVLEGAETNVPLDATREWVKSLPNARLLLIPNAGHMNWIDQPDAVISAMHEFFRGNWPAEITK